MMSPTLRASSPTNVWNLKMSKYFIFHGVMTLAVIGVLGLLRIAPPRFRFHLAALGIFIWALPIPLVRIPVLPEAITPYYTMSVFADQPGAYQLKEASKFQRASDSSWKRYLTPWNLWMVVSALGLLLWFQTLIKHHRIVKRLNAESRDGNHLWDILGSERPFPLKIMPGSGAMTTGLINPTIWIGEDHLEGVELKSVITHELTHILQRDNYWLFAIHLLERLFWWNPLILMLGNRARYYIELSCDHVCQKALGLSTYQKALASVIMTSAGLAWPGSQLAAKMLSGNRDNINRIKNIRRQYPMKIHYILASTAFLGLSTLLIAMPSPRAAVEPAALSAPAQSPTPNATAIPRVGQVGVEPPLFLKKVSPEYPKRAIKIKLEGFVILEAVLRKDGTVDDVIVLRGLGKGKFGFEESAITAVKQWEFRPGTLNGEPSDVKMTLKIDFVLKGHDDLNIQVMEWWVDDEDRSDYRKPVVNVKGDYDAAMEKHSTINIPIILNMDSMGNMVDFELDQEYLSQMTYPQVIRENVAQALNYHVFKSAVLEDQSVASQVQFLIKVPLKAMDLEAEMQHAGEKRSGKIRKGSAPPYR